MRLYIVCSVENTRTRFRYFVSREPGVGKQPWQTYQSKDKAYKLNKESAIKVCKLMNQWLDSRPDPSNRFVIMPCDN